MAQTDCAEGNRGYENAALPLDPHMLHLRRIIGTARVRMCDQVSMNFSLTPHPA